MRRHTLGAIGLIARRDLQSLTGSWWAWALASSALLIDGLLFNAFAMSSKPRPSADVLADLFYILFGTTTAVTILLSMRALTEERSRQTLTLLQTAPVAAWQVIAGKYAAILTSVAALTAATAYLPALIMIHGKLTLGQVGAGYLGVLSVASAAAAITIFCSSLTRSQLAAAALATALVSALTTTWLIARVSGPPFDEVLVAISFFDANFRSFMHGRVALSDLAYYGCVTALGLTWASARLATEHHR